jgi:hypothetical protein
MTSRSMFRLSTLSTMTVLLGASLAQAGVVGVTTLVRDPGNGINFTNPDAALAAPWVGYTLGLQTTAGELIGGIDVSIKGQLHQRWTFNADTETFDPTPQNNVNISNGDSKLRALTGALFAAGPFEDNSGTGSPLADTATADYGVGTTLSGIWGIPGASQSSSATVAYIVVPKGSEPTLDLRVSIADPGGNILGVLGAADFGFVVENLPPIVDDLGPLVGDMSLNGAAVPTIVSGTLPASDDGGVPPLTWMFDAAMTGPGVPVHAPSLDADTGLFSWDVDGSKGGLYTFSIKGTDAGGLSDGGLLTVNVIVPEPATLCLLGLALAGFAGFRRK